MNSLVRVKVHQAVEGQYLRDTCANRNNQIPIADMGTTSANGKPNGRQPIRHGVTDLKKKYAVENCFFSHKRPYFRASANGKNTGQLSDSPSHESTQIPLHPIQ